MKPSDKMDTQNGNPTDITIDDVARIAGVSVSTVSRILNDKPDVALGTRQRVKQVMEDLGYSPHALAQRLAVRRSRSIALVYPVEDVAGRGEVASFIVKAAFAAEEENYLFSLVAAPTTENRLLNLYRSAQVEGVILMEVYMDDWRIDLLQKNGHPFVMIGRCADNTGLSFVDFDFEGAVVVGIDHLVELKHQRIAFFNSGFLQQQGYGPAVRAFYGFQHAQEKHNIDLLHIEVETIPEIVAAIVESKVSAVVLGVHSLSLPDLVRAIWQQGYQIPEDVSIIVLQADEIAKNLILPMTSIKFDINTAAELASKMLINKLEGKPDEIDQVLFPPELIVRESTKLFA